MQRAIRGAITVDKNSQDAIRTAVIELISEIQMQNEYREDDVCFVLFTMTRDLDCIYPAKIVREEFKSWKYIPMMCNQELEIKNSLQKCIRVLITINTDLTQTQIKHVYLKGAKKLREDLV